MANLNKVMLIGRLTRDPEARAFSNGGKVVKFGFAVNNRKKNQQSGQWEDVPVFLDVEVFNRGENGRQADLVEQSLRKGQQVFIEGHLRMDQWETDGQKRSKIVVVIDNFQFLEARQDGMSGESGGGYSRPARTSSPPAAPARRSAPASPASNGNYAEPEPDFEAEPPAGGDDNIPF